MKTIKNYKIFKESLLDHLKGPTEEEIEKHIKKDYESGKINTFDYYIKLKDFDIPLPPIEELLKHMMNELDSNKISIKDYYALIKRLDVKGNDARKVLLNMMKSYEFDKNKGTGNIDANLFVNIAIKNNMFFDFTGFILLLIEDTFNLSYYIIDIAICYNNIDVLKFMLDENIYEGSDERKILLLKWGLKTYSSSINSSMRKTINSYIDKIKNT